MKVEMRVKKINEDVSKVWTETIDSEATNCLCNAEKDQSPLYYANKVIEYFNSTLKPGETKREVLSAREIE